MEPLSPVLLKIPPIHEKLKRNASEHAAGRGAFRLSRIANPPSTKRLILIHSHTCLIYFLPSLSFCPPAGWFAGGSTSLTWVPNSSPATKVLAKFSGYRYLSFAKQTVLGMQIPKFCTQLYV